MRQDEIRKLAEEYAQDIDSSVTHEDAYYRELARQTAENAASRRRDGWKAADYTALKSAVFDKVYIAARKR